MKELFMKTLLVGIKPNYIMKSKNIEELRSKIDDIDAKIVKLIEWRVEVAKKIGIIKKKQNL